MATIIDELIVTLGLDPKKFTEGQKQAVGSLRKMQEGAKEHGKKVEKSADDMTEAFTGLQRRLLGIAALFMGGMGMTRFAEHITKVTTAVGYLGQRIGMSAKDLQTWEYMGSRVGARAGEIAGSIASMREALAYGQLHGVSTLQKYFLAMGINPQLLRSNPNAAMMEMSRWASRQNPLYASQMFREMGMSPGMISLLLKGPQQLAKYFAEAAKLAPSDSDVKRLQQLTDEWGKLQARAEAAGRAVMVYLSPFLDKLIKVAETLFPTNAEKQDQFQQQQKKGGWFGNDWWGRKAYNWLWYGNPQGPQGGAAGGQPTVNDRFGPWGRRPQTGAQPQSFTPAPGAGGPINRSAYERELQSNPALRAKVMRIAYNEQGSNPRGTQAVIESMMNRAAARGTSLAAQAHWYDPASRTGYYAKGNMGRGALENARTRAVLERSLKNALAGGNVSNYATDNASGGLAARERRSGKFTFQQAINGETFFSPGWGGGKGGPASREAYERWRRSAGVDPWASAKAGSVSDSVVPHPGLIPLAGAGNVSHNNVTSSTAINNLNVYSATDDPHAHANDIRAMLRRNQDVTQATGGPN